MPKQILSVVKNDNPMHENAPIKQKNCINFFLFPMKSEMPESNGEIMATTKNAIAVTKLIKAEFLKLNPKKSIDLMPLLLKINP